MMQKHVLVTGMGGPSGVAAVTALKERGFLVTAVDMREVPHNADYFFTVPAAKDPDYLPQLQKVIDRQQVNWLFPTVSEELVLMAEHAATIRRQGVAIYMGAPQAVSICDDKWHTAQFLREHHIAVPDSVLTADAAKLDFPKVSRPRVGRGGRGVAVYDSAGQIPQNPPADLLWQEFMPGTEYDVLQVIHPDAPHERMATQVFEKTALREGKVGNALELLPVTAPDVSELALAAARAIGLVGPMDIDIRRNASGEVRLLEINARIGAHTLRAPQIFDALVNLFNAGHLG